MKTLGERLSKILVEVENAMWQHEFSKLTPIDISDDGFRAAVKIFATALLSRQWELQEKESFDLQDREAMSEECGKDIRRIVKIYTDIDTHSFYY